MQIDRNIKFPIFLLLAGCASSVTTTQYIGHAVRTSDAILAGQSFPPFPVEAKFEEHCSSATLYPHSPDPMRFDTLKFQRDSSGWRWTGEQGWKSRKRYPAW